MQKVLYTILAGKLEGSKVVDKRKGTWGMFTMNPDGSSKVQVPVSGSVVAHCWSKPDAQLILTSIGGLSTVPRTGGTPTAFVVEDEPGLPRGNSLSARWSPTGRIVFSRQCYDIRLADGYMQQCIVVKDWPDGPAQLLTEGYRDSAPAWSPDGDYVMFDRVIGASITKMVMPTAGGEPRVVGANLHIVGSVDWGRDAAGQNWLAYGPTGRNVYKLALNPDGTTWEGAVPVDFGDSGWTMGGKNPRWSPDCTHIVFSNEGDTSKYATYVLDASTGAFWPVGDLGFVDWAAQ
ncbi:MAG: hypothetical protein QM473_14200 [Acidobacteriota bacterium]|nr:hypothetical protein [Acidobacteriota bacterium]